MGKEVSAAEELKRWIAVVSQNAQQADAKEIQKSMDVLLDGSSGLAKILQKRCDSLAKQVRRNKPVTVKPSSTKSPKQPDTKKSDAAKQVNDPGLDAKKPPKEVAANTQKQQYLQKVYAQPTDDQSLEKAAKAIAR